MTSIFLAAAEKDSWHQSIRPSDPQNLIHFLLAPSMNENPSKFSLAKFKIPYKSSAEWFSFLQKMW